MALLSRRSAFVTMLAVILSIPSFTMALGGEPLPPISTTAIYRNDVVEAAKGHQVMGSIEFAYRDGDVVHYFVSDANCGAYVANPKTYLDAMPPIRLAFMGADPVMRFPYGVHNPTIGALINGNPRHTVEYENAVYAFATDATMRAFRTEPARYIPEVGGYCLGAMSGGHVTPGDPRNVYFVAEENAGGMWAVYGSPNGPIAWAAMTSDQRRQKLAEAKNYYQRFVHGNPPTDRIASK